MLADRPPLSQAARKDRTITTTDTELLIVLVFRSVRAAIRRLKDTAEKIRSRSIFRFYLTETETD
ncbi:hypothetical protein AA21952_0748 [Acetobacter oeni LMG 21952]|nr:hypothetical protein AA21952_0748 [Acetobacter oeni LMG 21952]